MLSFCEEDAKNLQVWGFNILRLYMSWEGVEPSQKVYNDTYLAQVLKVVQIAAKYDIKVFLDAHQDVYSRFFCGEGVPNWAVLKYSNFPQPIPIKFEKDARGYPNLTQCLRYPFFLFYFAEDAAASSQALWTNLNGLANDFADMWQHVAKYFKNERSVIGYELFNEPFGISPYDHLLEFIWPGYQNNKYLFPVY